MCEPRALVIVTCVCEGHRWAISIKLVSSKLVFTESELGGSGTNLIIGRTNSEIEYLVPTGMSQAEDMSAARSRTLFNVQVVTHFLWSIVAIFLSSETSLKYLSHNRWKG